MAAPKPSLATRTETVHISKDLGKAGQDRRSAEEFVAALERETAVSLRLHPERRPWTSSQKR